MGTISVFNHAALSYPYTWSETMMSRWAVSCGICKHLPRIKDFLLDSQGARALMNEAGLGNEGSPPRGCSVDTKTWASLGMVALLFKVNHSHKKQASLINAACSCAAKCVGSSHMMYCIPTALCLCLGHFLFLSSLQTTSKAHSVDCYWILLLPGYYACTCTI